MFNVEKATNDCIQWIRDWREENGPGCNLIVGISGGVDSLVAAELCVEAVGADKVLGVIMPNYKQDDIDVAYDICQHVLNIDYLTIKSTINELAKTENVTLVDKLLDILNNNKIAKSEKHNKKEDIKTNHYKIDLSKNQLNDIIDLLMDLEVESLTIDGESTPLTSHFSSLIDKWSTIKV